MLRSPYSVPVQVRWQQSANRLSQLRESVSTFRMHSSTYAEAKCWNSIWRQSIGAKPQHYPFKGLLTQRLHCNE
jgi:predicted oxidoreductase (fatty acid repression mutant protein)